VRGSGLPSRVRKNAGKVATQGNAGVEGEQTQVEDPRDAVAQPGNNLHV